MQAIGERLREARMRQKIDIAEVESSTKIRAKYLRALENDEFGLLPGSTFVKTFLRTYAEYLGLDATLLVEEYRVHYEPRGESEPMQHFAPPPRQRRTPRYGGGPPGPGTAVVVLVLAILVIFAVLGLTSGGKKKSASSPPNAAKKPAAKTTTPAAAAPPKPTRVKVRVVPTIGTTYVCVDNGKGTKIFEGILSTAQTFRGRRLRFNIGRTAVKITANGRRVKIPTAPISLGYEFTPRRTKVLPVGQRPCGG
jgi:cytoskeletal protein RodZ